MKITKLIKAYEKLIPIYKQAYNQNLNSRELYHIGLNCGICSAYSHHFYELGMYSVFETYYKNIVDNDRFLYPMPQTGKDLKSRIDFMESEIKDLNKLLKRGYTHV